MDDDQPRPVLDYNAPRPPPRRPFSVWVMLQKVVVLTLACACLFWSGAIVVRALTGPRDVWLMIFAVIPIILAAWLWIVSTYIRPYYS